MTEAISHPIHHDETGRRRVLLKLSGEVFGGGEVGISTEVVRSIAKQIAATVGEVETSIVIGGGNFFRGAELSQAGMDRSRADYMGMLGTVMNSWLCRTSWSRRVLTPVFSRLSPCRRLLRLTFLAARFATCRRTAS